MIAALAIVLAYVVGSFPSAYLAGRILKGVDLRTVGSGNLGATNVYREVGLGPAIVVLALDAFKGWLAVVLLPRIFALPATEWFPLVLGAAAIFGHTKPIFLLMRGGGKGVAAGGGVFLAIVPSAVLGGLIAFAIVVAATRYVSAASIAAALTVPIVIALQRGVSSPTFIASLAIGAYVVWKHRTNLRRIARGEERKIGRPGSAH